jgi:hypothetical protein
MIPSKKIKGTKAWANELNGDILYREGIFNSKEDAVLNGIPKCPCKSICDDCKKIRAIRVLITPLQ